MLWLLLTLTSAHSADASLGLVVDRGISVAGRIDLGRSHLELSAGGTLTRTTPGDVCEDWDGSYGDPVDLCPDVRGALLTSAWAGTELFRPAEAVAVDVGVGVRWGLQRWTWEPLWELDPWVNSFALCASVGAELELERTLLAVDFTLPLASYTAAEAFADTASLGLGPVGARLSVLWGLGRAP